MGPIGLIGPMGLMGLIGLIGVVGLLGLKVILDFLCKVKFSIFVETDTIII